MFIFADKIKEYMGQWLNHKLIEYDRKSLLCVVTGGCDSFTMATFLLKTFPNITTHLLFMGFKSESENEFEKWVKENFPESSYHIIKPTHPKLDDNNDIDCTKSLIPAYVDYYEKLYNALSVSSLTKSEYSLVSFYKLKTDCCYDCYPLIDLYKSECKELLLSFNLPTALQNSQSLVEQSFGYSFDELEWLDRENNNLSIVTAYDYPNLAPHWGLYNERKKSLLMKVYKLYKQNLQLDIIVNSQKCLIRQVFPGYIA